MHGEAGVREVFTAGCRAAGAEVAVVEEGGGASQPPHVRARAREGRPPLRGRGRRGQAPEWQPKAARRAALWEERRPWARGAR